MPSAVKDLTPLQRMWLYENQRTLSEEGSVPEADVDRFARNSCGTDHHQSSAQQGKASIFRARTSTTGMSLPPPSSSPSWNQHHNEPEARMMHPGHPMDEDPRGALLKRRRYSYEHHAPHLPHHHRPLPPYTPHSYYDHGNPLHTMHHMHHAAHPHHPAAAAGGPPGYPPYEGPLGSDYRTPLRADRRDDAPSPVERFPDFPNAGDKLTWQESYENLKAYKEHYGDCNVPQKYKGNTKLGGWVNKQRKKKRNPAKYGQLKAEHIKLMEEIDFKWQ